MTDNAKKYWLKLEEGFMDSGHIKVLKSKENGKDLLLFYLAIMLKSIRDVGHLRFSDTVPYDEEMLAAVTDYSIDTARNAISNLKNLGLLEVLENGTMFLTDMPKRVGKECDSAERVRKHREIEKLLQSNGDVTDCNANKEKDKDINIKHRKKVEPQNGDATAFSSIISLYSSNESLVSALNDFIDMRKSIKKPLTITALNRILAKLDKLASNVDDKVEILNYSICGSYAGIFELKKSNSPTKPFQIAVREINYDAEVVD